MPSGVIGVMVNQIVESLRQSGSEANARALQAERRFLRQLRIAIREPLDLAPGDFGLDRMHAELDRLEAQRRRQRIGVRLRAWWRTLRCSGRPPP